MTAIPLRSSLPLAARRDTTANLSLVNNALLSVLVENRSIRSLVAANVLVGRSLRAILLGLLRGLSDMLGWLSGNVSDDTAKRALSLLPFFHRRRGRRLLFRPRRWHVVGAATTFSLLLVFTGRLVADHVSGRSARRRQLRRAIAVCNDPLQWRKLVAEWRELSAPKGGRQSVAAYEASLYDRDLVQQRTEHLKRTREASDTLELMFAVRADLIRNLGGMASSQLHQRLLEIPEPIESYIAEVGQCLRRIASSLDVASEEKLAFLRETRHSFGRTALVLSGGGSFGAFHLGVLKALLKHRLLPRVLSGSSAGSIVAALVCTRTDEELYALFGSLETQINQLDINFYSSNNAFQIIRHLVTNGVAQDYTVLQERLQRLLGDVTFAEAHGRSGRVLNVSVTAADTEEPPRLLNYLTAPDVLVWSAVAASSAFPLLFDPQTLVARDPRGKIVQFANQGAAGEVQRRWRDGSLEEDLPMRGLSEMFSVNHFLVSQANPYLLPIIAVKELMPRTLGTLAESEFKHRCKQLMELLPRRFGGSRILKLLSQPWEGDITMFMPVNSLSALKAVVNLSKEDLVRAVNEGQRSTWSKLPSIGANCEVEVILDECLLQVTEQVKTERKRVALENSVSAALSKRLGASEGISPTRPSMQDLPVLEEESHNGSQKASSEISKLKRRDYKVRSYSTGVYETRLSGLRRGIPSWMHLQSLGIPTASSQEALGTLVASESEVPKHAGARDGGDDQRRSRSLTSYEPSMESRKERIEPEEASHTGIGGGLVGNAGDMHDVVQRRRSADIDTSAFPPKRSHMPSSASLPCMDDVWLELFSLAPSVNALPSSGGQALDVIAP